MHTFQQYLISMQELLDLREQAEDNGNHLVAHALTVAHSHLRSECARLFPTQWTSQ